MLIFITGMLLVFLLVWFGYLMPRIPRQRYVNFLLRTWALVWCVLIGLRWRRHGWKAAYKQQTMVIVTNHNSYLDTVVSYMNIRTVFRTLAKRELRKLPIMGQIFPHSGIMVDRSSPESRKASFGKMVDSIEEKVGILVYPEGTQNRGREPVQPFYDGAFRLAIHCQVPVLPIVTVNTRQLMPQAKIGRIRPGVMTQYFLEPLPTTGLTEDDLPEFKEKIRKMIAGKLMEVDPNFPD